MVPRTENADKTSLVVGRLGSWLVDSKSVGRRRVVTVVVSDCRPTLVVRDRYNGTAMMACADCGSPISAEARECPKCQSTFPQGFICTFCNDRVGLESHVGRCHQECVAHLFVRDGYCKVCNLLLWDRAKWAEEYRAMDRPWNGASSGWERFQVSLSGILCVRHSMRSVYAPQDQTQGASRAAGTCPI